jgi:hypothetical protein
MPPIKLPETRRIAEFSNYMNQETTAYCQVVVSERPIPKLLSAVLLSYASRVRVRKQKRVELQVRMRVQVQVHPHLGVATS